MSINNRLEALCTGGGMLGAEEEEVEEGVGAEEKSVYT